MRGIRLMPDVSPTADGFSLALCGLAWGTDPSRNPCPEPLRLRSGQACRMDQDDNVGNKMDGR
jgi:hypothetical protein